MLFCLFELHKCADMLISGPWWLFSTSPDLYVTSHDKHFVCKNNTFRWSLHPSVVTTCNQDVHWSWQLALICCLCCTNMCKIVSGPWQFNQAHRINGFGCENGTCQCNTASNHQSLAKHLNICLTRVRNDQTLVKRFNIRTTQLWFPLQSHEHIRSNLSITLSFLYMWCLLSHTKELAWNKQLCSLWVLQDLTWFFLHAWNSNKHHWWHKQALTECSYLPY